MYIYINMLRVNKLLLMFNFIFCTEIYAQSTKFVGYKENIPIFYDTSGILYQFEGNNFKIYSHFIKHAVVKDYNNDTVYYELSKNKIYLPYVKTNNLQQKIDLAFPKTYTCLANDGSIFYSDGNEEIKVIKNNKIYNTNIKGFVSHFVKGYLYFYTIQKPNDPDASYDIYEISRVKVKSSGFGKVERLIKDVTGEFFYVSPQNDKIIFDKTIKGVGYKYIFDVNSKDIKPIKKDDPLLNFPIICNNNTEILFYSSDRKKINLIKIP